MQYNDVENIVANIVFQPYFQDVDDTRETIGTVVPNPLVDGRYIQKEIIKQFSFCLPCNILDLSTEQLSKIVFNVITRRIQTKEFSTNQSDNRLTTRQVCGYILQHLGSNGPLGRQIGHAENFSDLWTEAKNTKKQQEFVCAFKDILNHFGVTMDPRPFNNATKIYNIGNMLTNLLVNKGMAISFEEEYKDVDLFFTPIRMAMTFNLLTSILKNHFEFWAPDVEATKKLTQTLLRFKSYDEYNQFMVKEGIKVKVDKAIFKNITLARPFESRSNMSDFVILPWRANSIRQDIEQSLNITLDYDISCSLASNLYMQLYDKVKDFPDLCDKLFTRMTGKSSNPKLTNRKQACSGLGKASHIDIADMDAPWAALNKAIDFGFLYSIWSCTGLKIPDSNLPNCRTFDEYKQIIITTLHKTFDGTDLDVGRDILQKNLTFVQYKQLVEKRKNHGR